MPPATRHRSRATLFLTVASLASMTVLLGGMALPAFDPRPSLRWRVGEDLRKVPQLTEVASGTPLALEVDLPFPAFVYVASWSQVQGTIALFPSERLASAPPNPLPVGTTSLPGLRSGKPTTWPTHSVVGPIHYLVIASRVRRPDLEEAMHSLRQMGYMAGAEEGDEPPAMYLFAPESGMKSALASDRPAASDLQLALATLATLRADSDGRMRPLADQEGVFGRAFVLQGR